jgi:hypothetical protein
MRKFPRHPAGDCLNRLAWQKYKTELRRRVVLFNPVTLNWEMDEARGGY